MYSGWIICLTLKARHAPDRQMRDYRGSATMGSMELNWQEYEQQRRRLNARLGLVVLALLPLPAILIATGVSALRMLLIIVSLGAV
jgi:hypothetical protein